MDNVVIQIDNISKEYRLGVIGYGTLSQDIQSKWAKFRGKEDPNQKLDSLFVGSKENNQFKALNGISFNVKRGEIVGIIGRNGAGKSTLLKILSQVTAPTSGRIKIKGRVASLLEVGTGFHPELTGRENIFLNGAILGMRKSEIIEKFDEIVRFAEIDKFIDTPVKRYSSGMYVRLAFAVAAHLEPEILILDEVLAVGDVGFQKKCLGKIGDVAKKGRTILFVSHNMAAIQKLCGRCILLKNGQIEYDSKDVKTVVANYLCIGNNNPSIWENKNSFLLNEVITPYNFSILDDKFHVIDRVVRSDESLFVKIEFSINKIISNLLIGYCLYDQFGQMLYWSYPSDHSKFDLLNFKIGKSYKNSIYSKIPLSILNDGKYNLQLIIGLFNEKAILTRENSDIFVSFEIFGNLNRGEYWIDQRQTVIAPIIEWQILSK